MTARVLPALVSAALVLSLTSARGQATAHTAPQAPLGHSPPTQNIFPLATGPLTPARSSRPYPEPPPEPRFWDNTTALGLALGLGAPYGYVGAYLAYNPARVLQVEVGAGYSSAFGPAVGLMGRLGLPAGNDHTPTLGVGLSTNFTDYSYVTNCTYANLSSFPLPLTERCNPSGSRHTVTGSVNPAWLNLELGDDLRFSTAFGGRASLGLSALLNTSSFPGAVGCPTGNVGRVPCDVGVTHQQGSVYWEFYARVDLYYLVFAGTTAAGARP